MRIKGFLAVLVAAAAISSFATSAHGAVLGAPTAISGTVGNAQVSLSWTAPSGSPALTDYIVEYTTTGTTWLQFSHQASTTASITVTGLTNNVEYSFRVSPVNSDGIGTASGIVTVTPVSDHTPNDLPTYSACPTGVAASAGFTDITSTQVDCIKYYGITKGTTATTYSPMDTVTRWQMALFLTRMAVPAGITLGDGTGHGFTDIGGKSAEIQTAIGQIKQLGITVGKTATTFAPDDKTTREEMALFLTRLLKKATVGPGGNTEYVTGSSGAKEIKSNDTDSNFSDLVGVTLYESQSDMTRKAMAIMMANALSHTNARPAGLVLQASTYRVSGTPTITLSATHRTAAFLPISGTPVDTFRFTHVITTTPTRFTATGLCSGTEASTVGGTKCTVDVSDPTTNASGNLPDFSAYLPAYSKVDFWAWTAGVSTAYDNDLHATGASKITIETTAGS
jgi:hypothetical protein